ncbi:MAG: hypothetical protein K2K19_02745 [Acetatifactor sp.]|nr:hypothetical protein [Acetatifactor sp.]
MIAGYLVELKKKELFSNSSGDMKKVICSIERLSRLLLDYCYFVFSAQLIDVEQDHENHEQQLEVWE